MHLYLITLEVDSLVVGMVYNPLPSHLTLVSRFQSVLAPDEIAKQIRPTLAKSELKELVFGEEAVIGPKKTAVYLIENSAKLKSLHAQLVEVLSEQAASFSSPQFIGEGHRPHVSKRQDVHFPSGATVQVRQAYLIEVEIHGIEHLRYIRAELKLGS